ncbi:cytochrome P450 [Blastococcus sp. BMG 814]|uniref:Cytochrome P450 n=1 Tax=Blastococcus carthaginiensis TaxID=3050034 RepID=A0ABT9IA66_9ACTN|nr:cytochrome P450 [Blastococcus carthaginiensis]MDP5182467.1 cytochrome P450 [Blastococcus carthaginiensis]
MIPALTAPDSSLALLREGYAFISRRCDRLGTDAFRTRLMLRPAVCVRGAEAARMFYGDRRFTRRGAFPPTLLHLLQDEGSVQSLDGSAHRARKELFLRLLQGAGAPRITEVLAQEWPAAVRRWQRADRVVLFDALNELLTQVAATWAGVPLDERDLALRAREVAEMRNRAGSIGPANWRAQFLRHRSERWARAVIARVRSGELTPPEGSAVAAIAGHRGDDGELLDLPVAGVELLNLIRPVAAVSRFGVFAALALLRHPRWRDAFAAGEDEDLHAFVLEVRRFFPFFPLVAGRVREPFTWQEHRFGTGDRVYLDLYGTDHDARSWTDPEVFDPERFRGWQGDPWTLIAQGAGGYAENHRCPGEPMTEWLLEDVVRLLTRSVRYEVGVQDFSISLNRLPTLPADGFVVSHVRPVPGTAAA